MVRPLAHPVLAPPGKAVHTPYDTRNKQQRSRHPSQNQELVALLRTDADAVALVVDDVCRFDGDGSCDGRRNSDGQESDHVDDDVDARAQAAGEEHADQCSDKCNESERNADAVEDEHSVAGNLERANAVVDFIRPAQIGQVNIVSGLVELALERFARVEAVHGCHVAAGCDILADVGLGDCVVRRVGRGVEALAESEQVGGVEIVQTEVFGDVVDAVVDFFLHAVGEVVEEGDDGVGGFGGGGVEEVAADAGGVELGEVLGSREGIVVGVVWTYCYYGVVFHETLLVAREDA